MTIILSLLFLNPSTLSAISRTDKRKARSVARSISHSVARARSRHLTRAELKAAEDRLAEMGYGTGPVDGVIDDLARNALIAFQKWEGRRVTGNMGRGDFEIIMSAAAPRAKDAGYRHVEVDLDRQVLLLTDDNGAVMRILPVSSGSN
ncbi:MAG TPA: peptidoglycan-binding domain-containing protein, partial [Pyrinomonadaceae bacterium]|nr:peptidoglycan-binding domain-containing protein [Pyrinomonadaceae bacterium]